MSIKPFVAAMALTLVATSAFAAGPGSSSGGTVTPKGKALGHPTRMEQDEAQKREQSNNANSDQQRMEERVRERKEDAQGEQVRAEKQVEKRVEDGEGDMKRAEERTRERQEQSGDNASQTAQQMRERNEERKEVKEQYQASDEKVKGKKPWWKFWGDEDA